MEVKSIDKSDSFSTFPDPVVVKKSGVHKSKGLFLYSNGGGDSCNTIENQGGEMI